jgi:pimeloyl-ACP methyl ester carboxylesterase
VPAGNGGAIEIGERRFAWTAAGTGPTQSFQVLCPDNRGFGGSDLGVPEELTVDAMAASPCALPGRVTARSGTPRGLSPLARAAISRSRPRTLPRG